MKRLRRTTGNLKESAIQTAIMRFLEVALPTSYFAFAVPNGGNRDAITGAMLKREGVKAGVADIVILRSGGTAACLEVKTEDGRLSDSQKTFRDWCGENGIPFAVVRSIDDVEETLRQWDVPLMVSL